MDDGISKIITPTHLFPIFSYSLFIDNTPTGIISARKRDKHLIEIDFFLLSRIVTFYLVDKCGRVFLKVYIIVLNRTWEQYKYFFLFLPNLK